MMVFYVEYIENIENSIFYTFPGRLAMKILSNEQLVAAYRDAEKQGNDQDWILLLKKEIRNRGLKPFRKS